jgi:CLIP-associating protein 1/2
VDEETFSKAFEDVPTIQLFSSRELEEQLTTIRETIADPNKDWSKRVDAVSRATSAIIHLLTVVWVTKATCSVVCVVI